jgi:hypothetical protein
MPIKSTPVIKSVYFQSNQSIKSLFAHKYSLDQAHNSRDLMAIA